jgi:hypothetical protein
MSMLEGRPGGEAQSVGSEFPQNFTPADLSEPDSRVDCGNKLQLE